MISERTARIAWLAGALALAMFVETAHARDLPYLSVIGAADTRGTIRTIRAEAHVTVSDGMEYDVTTVFHDHQRALFHRTYPDRRLTMGIDGKYCWTFDGVAESEGPAICESLVLGHQFHAQLLFFDELNGPLQPAAEFRCGDLRCRSYSSARGHLLRVHAASGRPAGLSLVREDGHPVEIIFEEWSDVEGVELPFRVTVDDGARVFVYEYRSVEFDTGVLDDLRAPVDLLTDEQKLLRLHRDAMDAHFFGDPSRLTGQFGADGVVASAGEVVPVTGAEFDAMIKQILSSRIHSRYDDVIRPIVRISEDGTLGWVVVQVEAEGVLLNDDGAPSDPFRFTSAWISLFEKQSGAWKLVGNVSNFKPDGS